MTSTFNPLDSIKATGTGNTLNIADQLGNAALPIVTVTGVQTANIQSVGIVNADTSGWTGLTALNVTASTGSGTVADTITAPGTAAVTVTETAGASTGTTTIDGGTTVSLTVTSNDGAAAKSLGGITIGGTTAPVGAVTVTDTATLGAASSQGNITVTGASPVTITSTVNDKVALTASTGTQTNGVAALITVSGAVGAVVVNDATAITNTAAIATVADAVAVTGGSTVTVNETVTTTQSAVTAASSITEGAVSVTGDSTTTSVTVNQAAVATGALAVTTATAAITGVAAVTAVTAAPGVEAVAAVTAVNSGNSAAAIPVSAGTPTITADGTVNIADANAANATTATVNTKTGTINSVTLSNFAGTNISSAALNTLSLSGTGALVTTYEGGSNSATNTALALSVNGLSATTLVDNTNQFKTINVTTGATKSTLTQITDSGLTTLNVAGSSTLTLTNAVSAGAANVATVAVSGAAGLSADLSGLGATLTSLTTTSSGVMTLTLDDTTQTFKGSTGQDVITLAGDATKAITGGIATNNEVILTSAASGYTAAKFGTNVTGFTTLGADHAGTDTYDMHGIFTGYNAIEVMASATTAANFTGVAAGTSLAIDNSETAVSYVLFPASSTASVNVALNTTKATTAITVGTLTLNDSNADGVATLSVASNNKAAATASGVTNIITTLADTSLTALNISGNAALQVGTISLGQPGQAVPVGVASFSITDNSVAFANTGSSSVNSVITTFTDDTLGSLNFAGTNSVTIGTLNDNNAVNLTINNTGTGSANITNLNTDANANKVIHTGLSNLTFTGSGDIDIGTLTMVSNTANLAYTNSGTGPVTITALNDGTNLLTTASLTMSGNIGLGTVGTTVGGDTPVAFADTAGVTIAAGTDNSHVSVSLTGAASGKTDKVTLGNANNYVVDLSTAGTVNVTVGTGSNYIALGGATNNASTAAFNVTLGAPTAGGDQIVVGTASTTFASVANYVVTGAAAGDVITFNADASSSAAALTATSLTAQTSVAGAIGALETAAVAIGADGVAYGAYAGNTYVVEEVAAGAASATNTTVVELANYTGAITASTGYVTVGSTAASTGGPQTTFTLTTAVDNFVGGSGNDTFTGTFTNGDAASTFNGTPYDTLNGGGGVNTLNINPTVANSGAITLTDAYFVNISHMQDLNFGNTGGGVQTFTFGTNVNAAFAGGLTMTTASTGGGTVMDTSATTIAENITIMSTGGFDSIVTGTGADILNVGTLANPTSGGITITASATASTATDSYTTYGTSGAQAITTNNGNDTVLANATIGGITVTAGTGNDGITVNATAGVVVINAGAGVDTINLGAHTAAATIAFAGAMPVGGSGAVTITNGGTFTAGDVIQGTAGFQVGTPDLIKVSGVTNIGGALAASGTLLNLWNVSTDAVFVDTATNLGGVAPTAASVSALIGTITTAANGVGFVAINVASSGNVWDLFAVDSLSGAHTATALSGADTITLVGTIHANGALTTANFAA